MNLEQVGLQLGLAGLVIVTVYRVAMFFIQKWAEADTARTKAWIDAEAARTAVLTANFTTLLLRLDSHASADIQSHGDIAEKVSRFEGKLDEILSWHERTPITEPRTPTPTPQEHRTRPSQPYHIKRGRDDKP